MENNLPGTYQRGIEEFDKYVYEAEAKAQVPRGDREGDLIRGQRQPERSVDADERRL